MKSEILNCVSNDADIQFPSILDENDLRRAFSNFVDELEHKQKQEKRLRRITRQKELDKLLDKFRELLESMVNNNYIININ